ncbi:MAG: hypothetical protein AAGI90_06440 [Chlamydiota bacterium]
MQAKRLARLESLLDHYETELKELQTLLIQCGFTNGIATLKESARSLLREQ